MSSSTTAACSTVIVRPSTKHGLAILTRKECVSSECGVRAASRLGATARALVAQLLSLTRWRHAM